eukprot:TRINITY_DN1004_c0_g2_i1.p1 TRINITY_DN1004_c0_g2~~TRINITY_DN1004_c0_g2_i1.p1  ORF type:complete len:618 (+),score=73.78 TRINITY_DN1004_c0_g2_i1:1225-3078(+)
MKVSLVTLSLLAVCLCERVRWHDTKQGVCVDRRGKFYHTLRKRISKEECFKNAEFDGPGPGVEALLIGKGGYCDILVDPGFLPIYFGRQGFWPVKQPTDIGFGPVGGNITMEGWECYPQVEACNVKERTGNDFKICDNGDIVGRDPYNKCRFYNCEVEETESPTTDSPFTANPAPPEPPIPAACACEKARLKEDFPETNWSSIPWYCAKISSNATSISCRPMEVVPTTGLPTGSCHEGWLECPGSVASSVLDPVNLGARCGCGFYSGRTTAFESLLCIDPSDSTKDSKVGKLCSLPSSTGTCAPGLVPCGSPRLPSIYFNTTINALDEGSPGWEWRIKSRLSYAMSTDMKKVELLGMCPKSACPGGRCPLTIEQRIKARCMFMRSRNSIPRDMRDVEFYLTINVVMERETERSRAIAELVGVYMTGYPTVMYGYLEELHVAGITMEDSLVENTGDETTAGGGGGSNRRKFFFLPIILVVALVGSVAAIAIRKWRKQAPRDDGLHHLKEHMMHEMKPVVETTYQPPIPYMPLQAQPPAVFTKVDNFTISAVQVKASAARVEDWRTNRVSSIPPDRDPALPLGESSGIDPAPVASAKILDEPEPSLLSNTTSSDVEMAI